MIKLVAVLFVAACALPTIRIGGEDYMPGITCLLLGCLTLVLWLPNLFLFVGCRALSSGRHRYAFFLGLVACAGSFPLLAPLGLLSHLSTGYYVWQADIVLFTVASAVLWGKCGARVASP